MSELSVLIVDDEAPARSRLRELLADVAGEVPNRIVGEAANGLDALELVEQLAPEAVLVDIRMPRMGGLELVQHLSHLPRPPAVVFTTAYDEYAIQAFEVNAVDYLLKPVRAQRLAAALGKVRARALPPQVLDALRPGLQPQGRSHLSCHERGRLLLIPIDDVIYLKADLKYVTARTAEREYLLDESLTHLEEEFADRFIRLHRSVLVAREAIVGFEHGTEEGSETHWLALVRDVPEKLPVSRRQWPLVKSYARQLSG